jgi:hypothetical protein
MLLTKALKKTSSEQGSDGVGFYKPKIAFISSPAVSSSTKLSSRCILLKGLSWYLISKL